VFALIEMAGVKEQKTCIKFCFMLNITAAEIHLMSKEAFDEQALSQAEHLSSLSSSKMVGNLWKSAPSSQQNKVNADYLFLDIRGTVHEEFAPYGQTVNEKFYCEVLKRLRQNVRRKRPEMWKNGK
jgi:hypothetical protein